VILLIEVVVLALVLGAVAAAAAGRGGELAPVPEPGPELPTDRPLTGEDLRAVCFDVAVRGYTMRQVDLLLDRLAAELEARDQRLAAAERAQAGAEQRDDERG